MKITKITAYKADDESLWETEKEAVQQNVQSILDEIDFRAEDSGIAAERKLLKWIRDEKAKVRYVIKNINNIEIE